MAAMGVVGVAGHGGNMSKLKNLAAAVALAALGLGAVPATAATIVLNDTGGVTGSPAERGFRAAAKFWETFLADDITISLNVNFAALGPNILGSTRSTLFSTSTAAIYQQLGATQTSTLDQSVVNTLKPLSSAGGLQVITPGYVNPATLTGADTTTRIVDNDDTANNTRLAGTSANLKALGFGLPAGLVDGTIQFSTNFAFDFNPTDGITAGQTDFIAVAIHEIGHALGFVSGVDVYDANGCPNGPGCAATSNASFNNSVIGRVGDLFRYSAPGVVDWTPGTAAYFSIDGGRSQLFGNSLLSTGDFNGDGFQASHFKNNGTCFNFIGILNPFICDGVGGTVTASDLAFFDAIGYTTNVNVLGNPNFQFSTAQAFGLVPEPATWVQMILGFGMLGGAMRVARRSRRGALAAA